VATRATKDLDERRAIEHLGDRLDAEVTLDALADHASADKRPLCRAFRGESAYHPMPTSRGSASRALRSSRRQA